VIVLILLKLMVAASDINSVVSVPLSLFRRLLYSNHATQRLQLPSVRRILRIQLGWPLLYFRFMWFASFVHDRVSTAALAQYIATSCDINFTPIDVRFPRL
jgi:hypothetical protein